MSDLLILDVIKENYEKVKKKGVINQHYFKPIIFLDFTAHNHWSVIPYCFAFIRFDGPITYTP